MASPEVIRSVFPRQPSARSAELRFYERLFLWNQGVNRLLATLRVLERFSFADKRSLHCTQAEIEEVRAGINADFVEAIGEHERRDQGRFWKQRHAYEKTLEDPDDVYFEVEEREEQRRKQGLPPRLVIVPHSVMPVEKGHIEAKKRLKKQHSRKGPKPTAHVKRSVLGKRHT